MMQLTRDQIILATAWHECGHALTAHSFGFSSTTAEIWIDEKGLHGKTTTPGAEDDPKSNCLIMAAGPVAEGLYYTQVLGKSVLMTEFTSASATNYEGGDFARYQAHKLTRFFHWTEACQMVERNLSRDIGTLGRMAADLVKLGRIELGTSATNHAQQCLWFYGKQF